MRGSGLPTLRCARADRWAPGNAALEPARDHGRRCRAKGRQMLNPVAERDAAGRSRARSTAAPRGRTGTKSPDRASGRSPGSRLRNGAQRPTADAGICARRGPSTSSTPRARRGARRTGIALTPIRTAPCVTGDSVSPTTTLRRCPCRKRHRGGSGGSPRRPPRHRKRRLPPDSKILQATRRRRPSRRPRS